MQTKGARVPARPYPFVDWMKALGMSVIVYGHVAHATTVPLTPPIYLKQFGVAFFLFATGFTLARERRSAGETVFNRLFQVYLFGLSLALLLTIVNLSTGGHGRAQQLSAVRRRAQRDRRQLSGESDDLVSRHLPALHADLGGVAAPHPRPDVDGAGRARDRDSDSRAVLMASAGRFVAYMLFTNWAAVFLLGMARGADADDEVRASRRRAYAVALARRPCGVGQSRCGSCRSSRRSRSCR